MVSENITSDNLVKNASIADKKSAAKYKITKVTKKKGRITGGTVVYSKPYNKNCTTITIRTKVKIGGVTFKVTSIANNAFKDCEKLTKVTISKGVIKIGKNAFKGCKNLKNIIFKSTSINKIGGSAFKGISTTAKFTLPKSKYSKYKKLIKKAGAPKKAVYKKK